MAEPLTEVFHGQRYWTSDPQPHEQAGWNTKFERCEVIGITPKKIIIQSPTLGKLFLNRKAFERDGRAYHSKPCEYFYPKPEAPQYTKRKAADFSCFRVLGISPFSNSDAVKKAYREKAKQFHPDTGGTNAEFIALKQAYDAAMKCCG